MLNAKDRDRIETRLLEGRERALEAIRDFDRTRESSILDDTGELSMHRLHPADIGTEAMEQEKQFLLASVEGRRLYDIDDALRRLYADPDGLGSCASCGGEIGVERLSALPYAALCANCQVAQEGEGA